MINPNGSTAKRLDSKSRMQPMRDLPVTIVIASLTGAAINRGALRE
jgi:hypothetical protein